MIESLQLRETKDPVLPWALNIPLLATGEPIPFKPGLNVIKGPNGSGKSSLLRLLGLHLAAVQGGLSTVTYPWLRECFGWGTKSRLPCTVRHDGKPVMYFDARTIQGIINGAFDDDFMATGKENAELKGSTGELGLLRLNNLLRVLTTPASSATTPRPSARQEVGKRLLRISGMPENIEWKVNTDQSDSRFKPAQALLTGVIPEGPRTLLMDEPESGFSLPWQARLWHTVLARIDPTQFQVIVATHSPFALNLPGVNYIELKPGFIEECRASLAAQLSFMAMATPQPEIATPVTPSRTRKRAPAQSE